MLQEIKIDEPSAEPEPAVDAQTDATIKANLLKLLEKKKVSMQISADCHAFLRDKYNKRARALGLFTITLTFVSFVLSTTGGGNNTDGTSINIPLAIITGFATAIASIKQVHDPAERANANDANYKTSMDLADDIEYVILKNNHTKKSLQQALDLYEERIKSFRKTEEQIPLDVKQMFIPRILD